MSEPCRVTTITVEIGQHIGHLLEKDRCERPNSADRERFTHGLLITPTNDGVVIFACNNYWGAVVSVESCGAPLPAGIVVPYKLAQKVGKKSKVRGANGPYQRIDIVHEGDNVFEVRINDESAKCHGVPLEETDKALRLLDRCLPKPSEYVDGKALVLNAEGLATVQCALGSQTISLGFTEDHDFKRTPIVLYGKGRSYGLIMPFERFSGYALPAHISEYVESRLRREDEDVEKMIDRSVREQFTAMLSDGTWMAITIDVIPRKIAMSYRNPRTRRFEPKHFNDSIRGFCEGFIGAHLTLAMPTMKHMLLPAKGVDLFGMVDAGVKHIHLTPHAAPQESSQA